MSQNNKQPYQVDLNKYVKYDDMNPDEMWNSFMEEHDNVVQNYFASLLFASTESSSLHPIFKQLHSTLPEYIEKVRHTETKEEISRLEEISKLLPQILLIIEENSEEKDNTTLVELFSQMTELGDLPQELLASLDLPTEQETDEQQQQCAQQ